MLKRFLRYGGSLLILGHDGGEAKSGSNVNYLLEEYGMQINNDAVVRPIPECQLRSLLRAVESAMRIVTAVVPR